MNKLFALSFAALIGTTSQSALAAETNDTPSPMHQAKHVHAASMQHGTHDMHNKACSAECKTAPAKAEPAIEAGTLHDAHVH